MKTNIRKSSFDQHCAEVAKSMQGYRPLTDQEAEELAMEETSQIADRLRSGKGLTTDQASMAAAVGISPHTLMSKGGKPCLPGFVSPADEVEEELRKATPDWAMNEAAYWRAVSMAEDKGKSNDQRWIRRLYQRLARGKFRKAKITNEAEINAALDEIDRVAASIA